MIPLVFAVKGAHFKFGCALRGELGRGQVTPRSEGRFAPMKRKGAPATEGKCPRDAPKDQKCDDFKLKLLSQEKAHASPLR